MNKYRDDLQKSEALTRYCLVDPFLKIWGWDVSDPSQVRPEYATEAGRPDYALLVEDKPLIYIGVKALGKQEKIEQYISYCITTGVPYFITTDGVKWEIYDTHIPKPLQEKKILEWDIINDKPYEIIRKAFTIWRPSKELILPCDHELIVVKHKEKKVEEGTQINKIKPKTGEKLSYSEIVFPDGRSYQIKHWRDVLLSIASWLIDTGKIKDEDLPLTSPRSRKRAIMNREPKHIDGSRFKDPKRIRSYFVEASISSRRAFKWSIFLLERYNISPSKVLLR